MLYLHRYAFALVMPSLATEWNVEKTELGFMQSAFYATYLAFQIPTGLVADWLGTHVFLAGIIFLWSAVLGLHAWAPDQQAMYGVRLAFGAAQAGCYPALGKVTQAWFPLSIRTSLQGWIASFFGRLGGCTAYLLFGALALGALAIDWRTAVTVLAAAGVVLAVAVLVVFRNAPGEHPRVSAAELALIAEGQPPRVAEGNPPQSEMFQGAEPAWWQAITPRSAVNLLFFLLQYFAATFADVVYVAWLPYFLSEQNVGMVRMGLYSSLPLAGGALGGMVAGYLNDLAIRAIGRRWGRSLVASAGNVAAAAMIALGLRFYDVPSVFCCFLFAAKFFFDWGQPTVWGTITDISGRHTATIFGLANGVGGLGALVAPPVIAIVAQRYSWSHAFWMIAATYLACGIFWLAVNCTIPVLSTREATA